MEGGETLIRGIKDNLGCFSVGHEFFIHLGPGQLRWKNWMETQDGLQG